MRPYSDQWLSAVVEMTGASFKNNTEQGKVAKWWFGSDSRFCLILGGERGGKSWLASFLAMCCMNIDKRDKRGNRVDTEYWIVGPDYLQTRPEFAYIYNAFNSHGLVANVSMPSNDAQSWTMQTVWGATIKTRSSGEVMRLASFTVDGVIMAEAAQQEHGAYLKLLGRVSETDGFLILAGTLEKGLPWYGELFERWRGSNQLNARSWSLPSWTNVEVYPGGREDPRIKELESEYPPDLFDERFGASPRRKSGLVLPEFDFERHVKRLTVNPARPVELAIDPASHTYAVLLLQYDGMVCNVLDRVYEHGVTIYDVIPLAMGSPYWQYIDLTRAGTIDNAGKQHQGNKSQVELWRELAGAHLTGKYIYQKDTIDVLRFRLGDKNTMHQPLIFFNDHMNATLSPSGLAMDVLAEPLSWSWPDRPGDRNKPQQPIDRNNDAMKALGYNLINRFGVQEERKKPKTKKRRALYGLVAGT